ncbi:hypothetical protein G7Y89_g6700 [Cudoniella acicularis]|uniref:Maf-like protein n=1 Tax=Cudoniella acicularis TaxID=354080 RepID=A0A8H4RMH8_9HELO|nr:hypothetical protein G7Y89_g6700 [Cudoniella acicularis]
MSDKKLEATSKGSVGSPPYAATAVQHGALPARNGPPSGKPPLRGPFPLDIPVLNQLRGKRLGLTNVEITPSTKPENLSKSELGPFEYVLQTAIQKCLDVYETELANSLASIPDPSLVVSADTIIVTNSGRILEKPRSENDHLNMLKMLRDQKYHKCYTAVAALAPREDVKFPGYNLETAVEETRVFFDDNVSDELIESYVKTREGADKAGGYGLQGMGSLLVEKIEGSWDNVVGLPLRVTLGLIEKAVLNQGEEDEEEDDE